jgi:hypothetical protein
LLLALLVVTGGVVAAVPITTPAGASNTPDGANINTGGNATVENLNTGIKTETTETIPTLQPVAVSSVVIKNGPPIDDRGQGFITDSSVNNVESDDSDIFRKVETNGSSFVVHVDLSLLTLLFAQGEELRLVTGGTVDEQRVVWFDIGITRTTDGFRTRADISINLPF